MPIFELTYDDKSPWPEDADGIGFSLVPDNSAAVGDQNDPAFWRSSANLHGSPGSDDGPAWTEPPRIQAHPRDLEVGVGNMAIFTVSALIVWSVVMLSLLACQDMFTGMKEMEALQQKLAEEFNTQNIGIKITNRTHLGVTFRNSQIEKLPKSEQESKARQIAVFIRDNYGGYRNLSTISVVFIEQNRYGPVSVTKPQGAFSFKTSELGLKLPQT